MATPKFDRLSVLLSQAIADPKSLATEDGGILSATERNGYVSRALMEFFNRQWMQMGDKVFMGYFPEMLKETSALTLVSGVYTILSTEYQDLAKAVHAYDGDTFIALPDAHTYPTYLTGHNGNYVPTVSDPVMFHRLDKFIFLPTTYTGTPIVGYIKYPLNPDGTYIAQGGAVDNPFQSHWDEYIVKVAVELYKIDQQEI